MGTTFCPKSEKLVFKQDDFFPFAWEFFACPHFKSDIRKQNRRSHVKLHNILFYSFKKEKMKWDENETLCWIMWWRWMTWKWSLAFNNDDGKKLYNLFTKKTKKLVFFPACHPSSNSIHVLFPEIEIKRQLRENFLLTRTAFWDSELQTIIYTDLSLSARINCLACLLSLPPGPLFLFLLLSLILHLFLHSLSLCT